MTLDTSGAVIEGLRSAWDTVPIKWRWSDLSPFTQGFVEAMFASEWPSLFAQFVAKGMSEPEGHDDAVKPEFSDLAPDTLERIIKDCEQHRKVYRSAYNDDRNEKRGGWFWKNRQVGMWAKEGFAPLRIFLNDQGQVEVEDAS